jgi:hypothetical protein
MHPNKQGPPSLHDAHTQQAYVGLHVSHQYFSGTGLQTCEMCMYGHALKSGGRGMHRRAPHSGMLEDPSIPLILNTQVVLGYRINK